MSGKNDNSLIGFDPLAWMSDDNVDEDGSRQQQQQKVIDEVKDEQVDVEQAPEVIEEFKEVSDVSPQIEDDKSDCKIILESVLNIQNVTVLYDQLLKALESNKPVEIDASAVSIVDTATLQLLAVFKQETVKLLREVSIDFPSDKFIESARLLGLADLLDVEQSAAGFF